MNNLIYYVVSANFLMTIFGLLFLAFNMDIINEKLKNKKDKDERHI
jgi:hypothetical protein